MIRSYATGEKSGWAACMKRISQGKCELILEEYKLYYLWYVCTWLERKKKNSGKMQTLRHRDAVPANKIEGSFGREFPAIRNHYVVFRQLEIARLDFLAIFEFFKTTPYGKIFKIQFWKFTWRHRLTLLCSNVVKFVRREIGEIVRYSPHRKQKQNFSSLSNCRYCADRAQNLTTFGSHCSRFHPEPKMFYSPRMYSRQIMQILYEAKEQSSRVRL